MVKRQIHPAVAELDVIESHTMTWAPFQYKDILSSYLTGMGNSRVKGKTAGKTSFRKHGVAHTGKTASLY